MKTTLSILLLASAACLPGAVLSVGPGKSFATPCQALVIARPGDVVEIDAAGKYDGDVCTWTAGNLVVRGIGGRAKLDAQGRNAEGKATWVISGNDVLVENIEFTNARSSDQNGAGIRMQGRNLILRNCYFHDNENGILSAAGAGGDIVIEYSEFAYNGAYDGHTHNVYISGPDARLFFRFNYSHHANVGHLLKTRARENYILYNRLTGEAAGTESYELDIPNGGLAYVIGNYFHKGPNTENSNMLEYAMEGWDRSVRNELYVINNTFVTERTETPDLGLTFVLANPEVPTPAIIQNNIFVGEGAVTSQPNAALSNNLIRQDPLFADPGNYDYRLLPGSPAIDSGREPDVPALRPEYQYAHPACGELRPVVGPIDIGAYEFRAEATPSSGPCVMLPLPLRPSITLEMTAIPAGASTSNNIVQLSAPAPSAGARIVLASSDKSVISTPDSVYVAPGETTARFSIQAQQITSMKAATISASYAGYVTSVVMLAGPLALESIVVPYQVQAGTTAYDNGVALTFPAPPGGATVRLSSSRPDIAGVPASVTISAGSLAATFAITAATAQANTQVTITATMGDSQRSVGFAVISGAASSIQLASTAVGGGSTIYNNLFIPGVPVAVDSVVSLSSSRPELVSMPASITVKPGIAVVPFSIVTAPVLEAATVTIYCSHQGQQSSATLRIDPLAVTGLSLSEPFAASGRWLSGNMVTLNAPAPPGGAHVALASSNPAVVSTPPEVIVPGGATSGAFMIFLGPVTQGASAQISASLGGKGQYATQSVGPR